VALQWTVVVVVMGTGVAVKNRPLIAMFANTVAAGIGVVWEGAGVAVASIR
jgi:hypothetical protein